MVQDVEGVALEDIALAQSSNHQVQAELAHVEDASSRDSAREEVDSWSWGAGVETLELLQRRLLLGRDGGDLSRAKEQGGEAGVEAGGAVEGLYPEYFTAHSLGAIFHS